MQLQPEIQVSATAARRARSAVTAIFCINGLVISSLAVRTPSLRLDLGLTAGELGLGSAIFGVSAVVAMQGAGRAVARLGSARVTRLAVVLVSLALVGVGMAPDFGRLAVVFLIFGAMHGTLDVAMNAHAVAVERALGRYVMNGCHAAWSVGAVAGSLLGSGAAHLDLARAHHYLLLAAVVVPVAAACGRALLPAGADREAASGGRRPGGRRAGRPPGRGRGEGAAGWLAAWRAGWTRRVLLLGAMGATVLTCEAAVANWSGVFLHDHLGAALGTAGLGYVAFTGCQTMGRLVGDRLQTRWSATSLVRVGTFAAAVGLAVAVVSPSPALGIVGFALMGVGLATPLPVLFGVVGHGGAEPGGERGGGAGALARFTTLTYAGILLAPAVIGWIADMAGLTWTLAGLIPLLAAVGFAAGRVIGPAAVPATGGAFPGAAA